MPQSDPYPQLQPVSVTATKCCALVYPDPITPDGLGYITGVASNNLLNATGCRGGCRTVLMAATIVVAPEAAPEEIEAAAAARMAGVRALGQAGEDAVRAAYDIGPKTAINVGGATRIPDGLLLDVLSEVKNVQYQSFSQQLRDFSNFALATERSFDLYLPAGARVSGPLQDAIDSGLINRLPIL